MATLVLQIPDESLVQKVKQACKMIVGVASVKVQKESKPKVDSTQMSKEEFYARIEKAEQQYERGEYTTQMPGESVSDMLKRCGYEL